MPVLLLAEQATSDAAIPVPLGGPTIQIQPGASPPTLEDLTVLLLRVVLLRQRGLLLCGCPPSQSPAAELRALTVGPVQLGGSCRSHEDHGEEDSFQQQPLSPGVPLPGLVAESAMPHGLFALWTNP